MAKQKLDLDLPVTPAEETKKPKYEFKDPYWTNKEHKHIMATIEYPNGTKATASIQDPGDGSNPDFQRILEEFGEDVLEENRQAGVKRRDEAIKKRMQRRQSQEARAKQEQLFNAKLEAFEISAVKESKNVKLKKLIRKAKSPMEVSAYTTILLMESMDDKEG